MAYDYIFTVGADASAIAKEVTKEMANVQSMMADNELLIKFTGDQKSLQDVLKKIQNADPSATIRFEGDQKSFQQLLSGLQGDIKKNLKLDDDQLGLKSAFDGIKKIASKTLQNVNLTPFFSRITDGFLDSTKSAQDLYDIISHTKDEIELLASLTNRTSLQYMTDKQIDDVIKKLREQVSLQQDYAKAVDEAKKHQDKFYLSRDKINEEIQKKNSRGEFTKGKGLELAKQLGITKGLDTTKSDNGELLIHDYSRTAALLDELIAKKKEFSETNPEGFLQQSKQIFDVFTRLSSLQDQMIKQFKIAKDAQELLLGNYDRNEIISDLNQAQMAYAERATKKQKQNVDAAKRELNEWLSKTAGKQQKKVERDVENTQKRAEEDNEKIPSRRKNNSIVQTGSDARDAAESLEEMGEAGQSSGQSVANGVGNATEAIEKLKGEIREAEEELDRLNSKKGERTSTINAPTFRKDYLKYEIEQLGKLSDPEEIDKKQKRIMDLYATYKKHFAGSPINSDELVKALKQIETAQADYLPNANAALDNLISDDMIDAQIQKIDKLKQELSKLQSFSQTNGVSGETVSSPTIDIDPNQALEAINKINDALKELPDSKEINISVNGPVAKSLDLLKGMKEIDSLYGKQESEEGIAFNDITGIASYVNQELGRGVHTGKLVDYLGGKANSVLHTHPNVNYAAFSGDEFKNMLETEYKKGITKQFVKAGREIAMLDIEKLVSSGVKASDLQEKFSQNWNKESTEKLQQKAQNVKLQDLLPQNYADIIRGKIQETITNSFSGSIVDNSLSQDLLKDIMNTITSNIQKRISSNETYGGEVVTEELDDAVKQLIQKRIKGLNISSLDAEKIGDDVLYDVDDLIGKEFKRFKSLTEDENMQVKQSALKNAIKSYGLDPSEIFKVMDQDEWLSSIYPQQLEKPIEVKIDTSKAEDQLEDLTKERTVKINIEDASLQGKSALSDFTETEKQSEAYADAAAQAVDNLGRKIDETFAKKVSGTALVDGMQRIITLFHHSDKEFDSFDLSKLDKNTRLGRGAYFGFDKTNMADFQGQDIMSQWYANVQNIFDTTKGNETQLDASQIESFIKAYLSAESEEYISNFRQSLRKGGLDAIKAIKAEANKSADVEMFKKMMGSLGYDAILGETSGNYGGVQQTLKEINVLDPSKIFKIDSSQFSELEKINSEIEEAREMIQSYKQDIEDFKAAAQDMSKSAEERSYFQELIDNGFKDENEAIRIQEERLQQLLEARQKLADAIITQAKPSNETPVSEPETHPEEFEREASAAAEDREEIEKLNNEKRESPEPQSDSAEIEKQGEAYREATADAEKFAEAKRETSGETPSSTAVSESFQREAEAVREAMTIEEQALDELKQKLVGEIPNAVDTKTQAFRSEQVEVSNLIDLEIDKVEELAKVLQSLFKGDSDSGVMSGLKDLFDSINKVKINKDTVQNLTDASWAIDTIGESFKKLSNEGLNSSAFDSLNDLLKKGEELKSLAKILDASEKKIATAGKAAGAGTTGKTTANPTKDATAEYKELLETIQAATKAKTELNKIETKQVNGKTVDAQLSDATSKSTGASKAAADAMARIDEMYKGGVISVEQYTVAQKALQDSLKGTAESVDALATAQKNAAQRQLKSDTQTQIEIYRKESEEYKKLYRMQNSGGISTQDEARMADLARYMTAQQTEWNAKIAQGAEFIEKMTGGLKTVAQLQADVSQEFSDKWTKGLNNQLETMEKQSSWRKGNWKEIIEELRQKATVFKENIGTRDYKENQKAFDALIGRMKATMKSEDFLPIRETWQSSFTAKIETWANQNKIAAKEFGEQLETLKGQIAAVDNEAEASRLENIFSGIQSDAASKNLLGKSLGDRFKDQFKNTMTSLATYYLSFQDFIRYGREAISVVTELDTQLTEMRKVSNESLQTLQQYQLESFDIADRVGTTASQIQSSTADWMRLGEDLQEAKKSAEQSTLLLNVSEFSDIDAATKSLTSMSQAYKELEKSEIIDKLNNIGNNFSISTSELAESLQKSAGTLKVTGDSLDEAIALTVAGNQVLQNPDIVGQSLKTISLRLSGTSVKDMQEAGEEIDGLITTQSKLRQVIMDATKVASNNYKGFDILNDDGSYKTTYERLLGIAEVFKEIGEEDKKFGTNRQSFLLETIANSLLWYVEIHMRNIFNCR